MSTLCAFEGYGLPCPSSPHAHVELLSNSRLVTCSYCGEIVTLQDKPDDADTNFLMAVAAGQGLSHHQIAVHPDSVQAATQDVVRLIQRIRQSRTLPPE